MRFPVLLSLVVLSGCAPDPTREGVRLACEDAVASWTPLQSAWDMAERFDRRCARTLGDSIKLYWDAPDLELNPADLRDNPTATYLLAGVFVLAADQTGTVGAVLADPYLPALVQDPLRDAMATHGLDDDDPADALWFAYAQDAIAMTMVVTDEGVASYDLDTRVATFKAWLTGYEAEPWDELPPYPASVLIHEATHSLDVPHIPCVFDPAYSCDETPEGANGVDIWWRNSWILRHPEVVADRACENMENHISGSCKSQINEVPDDWAPCDRVCSVGR